MVQCTDRVVQLVVIEDGKFVVDLSAPWTVVECGFVQVDGALKISLS